MPSDPEDDGKTACIGGFRLTKCDELQQWVETYLNETKVRGWQQVIPTGPYAERVRVRFLCDQYMWKWLRDMQGEKIVCLRYADQKRSPECKLWHCKNKGWEAQVISKKAIRIATEIRKLLMDKF